MPPKKKKQPKNAFYFFMVDWKAEKEEQGQRFSGMAEVAELCAEDFKYLPEFNKKKYKDMEKEAKLKDKDDRSNKFNSLGVTFEQLDREERERNNASLKMESDISNTMMNLSGSKEALMNHCFYLAHANVYCYWGPEKVYIPCEVAISKFNLKHGVIDTYHVFPCPFTPNRDLPLGYKFEARSKAETIHEIPEPSDFDRMELDWDKIRNDVYQFLKPSDGGELPPIFTMDDDSNTNSYMTAVKNFLDNVTNMSDEQFRVYTLPLLFFRLYNTCQNVARKLYDDNEVAFPVIGLAQQQLMKDVYNFSPGLACDFHEPTEHYHNCSLSFVKRWVYLISEFCCRALRIELIPGRHCLSTARIAPLVKEYAPRPQLKPVVQSQPQQPPKKSGRLVNAAVFPPHSSSGTGFGAGAAVVAAAASPTERYDDDDDDNDGWCTVPCAQRGMKNLSMNERKPNVPKVNEELVVIDRSKEPDPSKTRMFRSGQTANVVSEVLPNDVPSVRLPTTRGRGELLMALQASNASPGPSALAPDGFPALGSRNPPAPGRLANPISSGWGRGFLNKKD